MWGIRLLTWGLPWVIVPGVESPYFDPKTLLFTAGGWGLIAWRLFRLPTLPASGWRNPWTLWLTLWVIGVSCWRFQWLFLRRLPGQSYTYNEYVWLAAIIVLMALLLTETLTVYLRSDLSVQLLSQWMCLCAGLVALYGLCQFFGLDQWYVSAPAGKYGNPVSAGFGNPGYLALYLSLVLPLCFVFSAKRYLGYAFLILIGIWLTHARYAWAVAGIGLASSFLSRWWTRMRTRERLLAVVALGVGLVGLAWIGWGILQTDQRLPIWMSAWKKLCSSSSHVAPSMTGFGLDSFGLLFDPSIRWAHNEWIHLLVEVGLIGTSLTALMVAWSVRTGWRMATRSVIISGWFGVWMGFLASTLVHFPGHIPPLAWVGLCAWAVMERGGAAYG